MNHIVLSIIPLFSLVFAMGQTVYPVPLTQDTTSNPKVDGESEVFITPEQMPYHNGGNDGLYSFIYSHFDYAKYELECNIEGTVIIALTVEKDGKTTGHKIVKGINGGSGPDLEALRISKLIFFETPAMMNNLPIRYRIIIPIHFGKH
jgi:outer membrane biosynthesis protein TonB